MALRGEMRSMLRRRIDDVRSSRWPDNGDLDGELNAAAQYVFFEMSKFQRLNFSPEECNFVTDGVTRRFNLATYPLDPIPGGEPPGRAVRLGKVWSMYEMPSASILPSSGTTDTYVAATSDLNVIPCMQVDERQIPVFSRSDGKNSQGYWMYAVTTSSKILQEAVVAFAVTPGSRKAFHVNYVRYPDTILPNSAADDLIAYDDIPERFHELVVVRAGLQLVGTDEARYDFLQASWNDLYAKMIDEVSYMPDLHSLRLVPREAKAQFLSPATRRARPEAFGSPTGAEE